MKRFVLLLFFVVVSCNESRKSNLTERKLEVAHELVAKKKELMELEDTIKKASDIVDHRPSDPMCGQIVADLITLDEQRKLLVDEIDILEERYRGSQPE